VNTGLDVLPVLGVDLTPELLTAALHSTGTLGAPKVTNIDVVPIGQGQGFVGTSFRCALSYDHADEGTPQSAANGDR
jgi:hypothetical protein